MIEIEYEIVRLLVYPEKNGLSNVVGKAVLKTIFSRNGVSVEGRLSAYLDTDNIDPDAFIDAENLDVDTVSAWVVASRGGEEFISSLKQSHDELLSAKEVEAGLVDYQPVV